MSRWEDLPPVDIDGWVADQGRHFLDRTSQQISRLGLPDFFASTQQRIQAMADPLGQLYTGLEQGLAQLPSAAQEAASRGAGAFNDYATNQIATLGQGVQELTHPQGPSEAQRVGGAIGNTLGSTVGPVLGSLGNTLGQGVQDIGAELGQSAGQMGAQMGEQLQDTGQRNQQEARSVFDSLTMRSPEARAPYERNAAALAQQRSVFDEAISPMSRLKDTAAGGTPDLRDVGTAFTDTLGNLASSELAPSDYARNALTSGRQRLLETGQELGGGEGGGLLGRMQGSLDAIQRAQAQGDIAGSGREAAGLVGNTVLPTLSALGAIPNALVGAATGGLVGGEHNLAQESGLNEWLNQRGLPGVRPDTLALGGLANPAALGGVAGQAAIPATALDDLIGILVKGGVQVARSLAERFMTETGPAAIRLALEKGPSALADVFDDYLARAARGVPEALGGETGPLGRLIGEEGGGLRTPFGRRAAAAAAPPTPGAPIPNPTEEWERAYNDALLIEPAQAAAAKTPGGPAPIDAASPLRTFDETQWAGKWSRFRQLWTDENARLVDVQAAVEDLLGHKLGPDASAVLQRRLYAGRQAAADQWIEDELTPVVRGLSQPQVAHVEQIAEQLDDVGRARAIQNRVTAEAAGQAVGPVAGETALRNNNQSLRMRQGALARALTEQDAADTAARQAQAELRRVRTEGRREVRGSQGRGRPRIQRTPAEQAKVEADAQARLDAARTATVEARAAAREAARAANVNLSKVTRADLKRMRLQWETNAARAAKEAEIAEGAATKGAEAGAARRFSGGVTGADYSEDAVWQAARARVADRLGPRATPEAIDRELATVRSAVEGIQSFSRALRARLHDAGIISDELYERWERDFPGYIRTNILKYMDEEAATGVPQGAQRWTVQSLVGAGQDVGARMSAEGTHALREQPLNTLIRMTHGAETLARRNENAQTLERLIQADPSGELAKAFRPLKAGEEPAAHEATFAFYKNGEPVRYAVDKRFEGLFNLPPSQVRAGLDALGTATGKNPVQQALTTYNPAFIAFNAMRDYQVYLRREARSPVDAVRATGEELKAGIHLTGDALRRARLGPLGRTPRTPPARTADYRRLIRAGGGQDAPWSGLSAQQARNRMLLDPDLKERGRVVSSVAQVADALTKYTGVQATGRLIKGAGAVVEGAPRLAAGRRAQARGLALPEGALAMRDVTMDFSRGGTAARDLNRAIPFFNAAIQASARFYGDDLVNRRGAVAAQAITLILAKAGLEAYNQTYGDDYADVPTYLKDTGLVMMLPGDVAREKRPDGTPVPGGRNFLWFPISQDLAAPLRVGMQAYRRASGQAGPGFGSPQDAATSALGVAADAFGALSPVPLEGGPPLPPLIDQAVEQVANRDLYRDRPIVPDHLADRPPEDQYTPQTSALGRVVGGALGSVGGPGPTRVDYAVQSLGGAPGRELLRASDVAARAVGRGDLASRPYSSPAEQEALDTVRQTPVLGNLVGGLVRQSGGQLDADAEARIRTRMLQAQRDARDRLQANPAYARLSPEQRNEILRRELDRIRRQMEAEVKADTELRRLQRVRTQR